jgi:hypothetical protein
MSRGAIQPAGARESAESTAGQGPGEAPGAATALLGSQVAIGRVRLGVVRDVLFGADLAVVLGLTVETEAGRMCFLPWAGAVPERGSVLLASPRLLLGEVELDYYIASGMRLSDVLGAELEIDGRTALVREVTFHRSGATADVIAATDGRLHRPVPVGDLRVHWSAGRAPRLALGKPRRAA